MSMKTYLLFILSFFYVWNGFSQSQKRIQKHNSIQSIKYSQYISVDDFFNSEYKKLGLDSPKDMTKKYVIQDKSGLKHIKYKQFFNGLPVVGGTYILHEKDGLVKKATGCIYPYINLSTKPSLDKFYAKHKAYSFMEKKLSHEYDQFDSASFHYKTKVKNLCVIDTKFPDFSGEYRLAYQIELIGFLNGPIKEKIYIDAQNGQILFSYSDIHHTNIKGKGNTIYYGEQEFMIDSVAPNQFLLQDKTRGNGIFVVDASKPFSDEHEFGSPIISNDSKNWNFDGNNASALDAHYCAAAYYDMLQEKFDRNSIDNNGTPLVCGVHVSGFTSTSPFYVNAYWDGDATYYGDGDCDDYSPLTTLSIVGHEFTHGLTDYTSDLVYAMESGAINEAMSDIFGKALEYYIKPEDFSWWIDKLTIKGENGKPFRNMQEPNLTEHPKYYKGYYWDVDQEVHTNSNVFNFWFYLLVDGNKSTNEKGINYDVKAIGMDKAIDIVYGVQTGYLTENSNYQDLYDATISETIDLFGEQSEEMASVEEAWKAVGLDRQIKTHNNLKLTILDIPRYNQFFPIPICDLDKDFALKYEIRNAGITVDKGSELNVIFETASGTEISSHKITLNDDLTFNKTLIIQDSVKLTKTLFNTGWLNLIVKLDREDAILSDNEGRILISNNKPHPKLSISIPNSQSYLCDQDYAIKTRIANYGCTPVLKGQKIELVIDNHKETITSIYEIPKDLNTNDVFDFELEKLPKDFGPFNLEMRYDIDGETNINKTNYLGAGAIIEFPKEKVLDFEDNDFLTFLKLRGKNRIQQSNQSRVFGFVGIRRYFVSNSCADVNDFFISQSLSEMSFCVNASTMDEPTLSFDLQFIGNNFTSAEYDFPQELYTMVRVKIGDEIFPVIYDQELGKMINYRYDFPPNFVGQVSFQAFVLGNNKTNLLDNNWVLFDNIRVFDKKDVATNDIENNTFNIYPNPATDMLTIIPKDRNANYEIKFFDILGQEIGRKHFIGDLHYDVSRFNSGSILYQIIENGHINTVGKVAIVR